MRVVFLIRSLHSGGAERQLIALVRNMDQSAFEITIITYYPGGELARDLHGLANVRLVSVDKRGRWDFLGFMWRLYKVVREVRPHVIHGYMYGANEVALLLGRAVRARVVWGVRASGLDMTYYDWATRLLYKTGAWLSSYADALIANSDAGRRFHAGLGYPERLFSVIPNGIDTERYRFDETKRLELRSLWAVRDCEILIGIVARIDPMKDHETFLRAAAVLVRMAPEVRFAVVGATSGENLARLTSLAVDLGIDRQIVWAGIRHDMNAVYSAIDIATSTSAFGEGFSNSLAEAMACERVCVATDVGDARAVVGDKGELVPPRHPDAVAAAWHRLLDMSPEGRASRGREARARIVENFGVTVLAARTSEVLHRIVARVEPATSSPR